MVRPFELEDTIQVALLLKLMTQEIMPEHASDEDNGYFNEVVKWSADPKRFIYVDHLYRGFFVVVDDAEEYLVDYHRYVGTQVYIDPEFRNSRLLSDFYKRMFKDFTDGDIIGITEIDSAHIPVLEKRHKRIANVYILNKERRWE